MGGNCLTQTIDRNQNVKYFVSSVLKVASVKKGVTIIMQPFSSILLFVFVARYLRESQILEDDDKLKTSLRFKYTFTVI